VSWVVRFNVHAVVDICPAPGGAHRLGAISATWVRKAKASTNESKIKPRLQLSVIHAPRAGRSVSQAGDLLRERGAWAAWALPLFNSSRWQNREELAIPSRLPCVSAALLMVTERVGDGRSAESTLCRDPCRRRHRRRCCLRRITSVLIRSALRRASHGQGVARGGPAS